MLDMKTQGTLLHLVVLALAYRYWWNLRHRKSEKSLYFLLPFPYCRKTTLLTNAHISSILESSHGVSDALKINIKFVFLRVCHFSSWYHLPWVLSTDWAFGDRINVQGQALGSPTSTEVAISSCSSNSWIFLYYLFSPMLLLCIFL